MRGRALLAAGAVVGAGVLMVPGVAWAHHVFLDVNATGAQVPGGDPDGNVTGVIDFDDDVSNDICINATSSNLGTITSVLIVNKTDSSTLFSFGTSLKTCLPASDAVITALHDTASEYRFVVSTQDFPEGAVASELVEEPPSTTTSSTTTSTSSPTTSSTSTTTTAPLVASNTATTPAFTG
ncbi:MAG: hypothetical protein U0Q07_18495 [Acidimicrobiales bacterium]